MSHINLHPKRILLIDDDPEDSLLFQNALKEAAPAALFKWVQTPALLETALPLFSPDIIFLDTHSPRTPETLCIESLMANHLFQSAPVVIHSATRNPLQMAVAYNCGVHLFFKKPSHYKVLVMGLRKVLELDLKPTQNEKAALLSKVA